MKSRAINIESPDVYFLYKNLDPAFI